MQAHGMVDAHGWYDMFEPEEAHASADFNGKKIDAQKSLLRALGFLGQKLQAQKGLQRHGFCLISAFVNV